ncbi:unnamed protein product [Rotaria magnacalcarata]|uniref:Uncharacterized protein n=2 Tax=Rotaria magnacalcarata TaxID=392030 RepID=A0A816WIH8_9BILA|nr:unnamed protein product [Rotaria magnacalcarata]CAF4579033.1 unnamed protein product [Rotaria magnacalcarata]
MKSKDLQKLVLSKYENGDSTSKIFNDLNGSVSYHTIRRWCKMIRERGSIDLSHTPGRPPIVRTKVMIRKLSKRRFFKNSFFDEKIFDLNGMYNTQNDRVWTINREEADKNGGVKQRQKFPERVMVWLGVCSRGVTLLVILDEGTVNHQRYIDEVLPVAWEYANKMFGD